MRRMAGVKRVSEAGGVRGEKHKAAAPTAGRAIRQETRNLRRVVLACRSTQSEGGAEAGEEALGARAQVLGDLLVVTAVAGDVVGGKAVVVTGAEQLVGENGDGDLVEVALGGGGVHGSVAVIGSGAEEVGGKGDGGDGAELSGLGGGVDDGVAGFTGDEEGVANEVFCGDVVEVAGEGGGVENGVAGGGFNQEGLAGKEGAGHLGQVSVQGGGVQGRLAGEVGEGVGGGVLKNGRNLVQMARLGGLVEEGVAQMGADAEKFGGEDRVGKDTEVAVGGGHVINGETGVAGLGEQVVEEEAWGQAGGCGVGFEGVVQRGVAGLVFN